MKGVKELNDFLEFLLASCKLNVDVNTLIDKSIVHIFLLYVGTGNLGFDTNCLDPTTGLCRHPL